MPGTVPDRPKLYHIVHVDRLASIAHDGFLFSDAAMAARTDAGTTIGMSGIKRRRLEELELDSHPGLKVGECVPFYFCPRSVMLFVIKCASSADLAYKGGQRPIVHMQFDLGRVTEWAGANGRRWAFTLSNAGARYFADRNDLAQLNDLDWTAIGAKDWRAPSVKEGKQAEFLCEGRVPWDLLEGVGVIDQGMSQRASDALPETGHRPPVGIRSGWYY